MAFATDYKNLSDLMAQGEYELVISDAYEDAARTSGTPFILLLLVVRNDIEQQYQNKAIWHRMYLSDAALPYSERRMNTISKCVGLPEGMEFESYDHWCNTVRGLPIRAYVNHREFNGDTSEDIRNFRTSKTPECKHVWKDDKGAGTRRIQGRMEYTSTTRQVAPPKPKVDVDQLPF
ncbi:DUF669 domain-containing protein [Eubacteriales bacterium OttesenSCG-928-A19]|nr:DUF669 domain-containing protein [Eubacteriales bacterium OttesenSCG-928-A19]